MIIIFDYSWNFLDNWSMINANELYHSRHNVHLSNQILGLIISFSNHQLLKSSNHHVQHYVHNWSYEMLVRSHPFWRVIQIKKMFWRRHLFHMKIWLKMSKIWDYENILAGAFWDNSKIWPKTCPILIKINNYMVQIRNLSLCAFKSCFLVLNIKLYYKKQLLN